MVPTGHTHEPSPYRKIDDKKLANDHYRLRLGYRCTWEIVNQEERECNYCEQVTEEPLLHYLLECEATDDIRIKIRKPPHNATEKAKEIVYSIIEKIEETKTMLLECPPPR